MSYIKVHINNTGLLWGYPVPVGSFNYLFESVSTSSIYAFMDDSDASGDKLSL